MQRFFVEPHQIDRDRHEIRITGNDVNHIVNVLRMKKDEELWISDKEKEYHCVIENAGEDEVLLHILYVQEPDYELQNRIYLFQGLPKADKMELIIQKAVELGAYSVVPVSTRRCVVKLDNKKAEKKVSRWQQIAESAAKQSKRMLVPEVHSVMTFKEALVYAKELDVLLPARCVGLSRAGTKRSRRQAAEGQLADAHRHLTSLRDLCGGAVRAAPVPVKESRGTPKH